MNDDLLTAAEVAQLLKVKKNTVYDMIKRGDIPCKKIGKQFRISRVDIERMTGAVSTLSSDERKPASAKFTSRARVVFAPNQVPIERENGGIILCGQDMSLDIIANDLSALPHMPAVLRSYTGSYNGLYQLYRGKADICTVHLWHERTGTYNLPYIEQMLPGMNAIVARLFGRMIGFYVKKGNPKHITTWEDLKQPQLRFVNREPGSGTRVLLDQKIKAMKIKGMNLLGYDNVQTSYLSVASAVARGEADVGLGMQAAERQYPAIEFIPLQKEWVDLVFLADHADTTPYETLLDYITSEHFLLSVGQMGDYDFSETGRIFRV